MLSLPLIGGTVLKMPANAGFKCFAFAKFKIYVVIAQATAVDAQHPTHETGHDNGKGPCLLAT